MWIPSGVRAARATLRRKAEGGAGGERYARSSAADAVEHAPREGRGGAMDAGAMGEDGKAHLEGTRQAKVCELDAAVTVYEHILRLEVAV